MSPTVQVATIPAEAPAAEAARFIVGQDPEGYWVALEMHGRAGGLFRSRADAVDYAEDETDHRPDAVLHSGERIELRICDHRRYPEVAGPDTPCPTLRQP